MSLRSELRIPRYMGTQGTVANVQEPFTFGIRTQRFPVISRRRGMRLTLICERLLFSSRNPAGRGLSILLYVQITTCTLSFAGSLNK